MLAYHALIVNTTIA